MNFKDFLKNTKPKLELLIYVKEQQYGINTYVHPDINDMDDAYKSLLSEFLKGIIKTLEKKQK